MSYATPAQMVERFGQEELIQVSNRTGYPAAEIDPVTLAAALKDGSDLIDGYLGKRYAIPLKPVPSLAVRWNCDLARWFLQPGAPPEMVKANYERTLEELQAAADGSISLGVEDEKPDGWRGDVLFDGPGRNFRDMRCF